MSEELSEEARVERAKLLEDRAVAQADADLIKVLELPEGRRFVHRIIHSIASVRSDAFSVDSLVMARATGRISVGLKLESEAWRVSKKFCALMDAEALEAALKREQELDEKK